MAIALSRHQIREQAIRTSILLLISIWWERHKVQGRLRLGDGFAQRNKGRKVVLHRSQMSSELGDYRLHFGIGSNLDSSIRPRQMVEVQPRKKKESNTSQIAV